MDLKFETVATQLDLIPIAVPRFQLGRVHLRDCGASTFESLFSRFRKDSPNGFSQDKLKRAGKGTVTEVSYSMTVIMRLDDGGRIHSL
jgi:hypothetical protein